MSVDLQEFMKQINARLDSLPTREQVESIGLRIQRNKESITSNKIKIKNQEKQIASLRAAAEKLESKQIDTRRGLSQRVGKGTTTPIVNDYWAARKSIEGSNEITMKDPVSTFLADALGTDVEKEIGDFSVK